jgi:hypothetical protein
MLAVFLLHRLIAGASPTIEAPIVEDRVFQALRVIPAKRKATLHHHYLLTRLKKWPPDFAPEGH